MIRFWNLNILNVINARKCCTSGVQTKCLRGKGVETFPAPAGGSGKSWHRAGAVRGFAGSTEGKVKISVILPDDTEKVRQKRKIEFDPDNGCTTRC